MNESTMEINEIAEKIRNNDIDLQTIGNADLLYDY